MRMNGMKAVGLGLVLSFSASQIAYAGGCKWGHSKDATASAEISTPEIVAEVDVTSTETITLAAVPTCVGLEGAAYVQCVAKTAAE